MGDEAINPELVDAIADKVVEKLRSQPQTLSRCEPDYTPEQKKKNEVRCLMSAYSCLNDSYIPSEVLDAARVSIAALLKELV